jgi:hypothetical protein
MIYGHHDGIPPTRGDRRIQFRRPNSWRQGVYRNTERHVWPPTHRNPCKLTVTATFSTGWLSTYQSQTWIVDT